MFAFSESCLSQKTRYAEIWLCFCACDSRIVTYDEEFCLVVWFCVLITITESSWKVSLKKSWCCWKHVFVFEIVSLKRFEWVLIKLSFSKRFVRRYGKSLKTFPFWELTFSLFKKVKLLSLGGWLLSRASQKVLMCSLF